jgi:nicotinamide riboside kinase
MLPQRVLDGHHQVPQRVYLVGAHATGKTTLARWVRDRYGMPMIAEVARGVLAEMEARLDSLRTDIDLVNRYQAEVFARQIEAERKVDGVFVSDRAFCNLAYAAHHSTILAEVFRDPRLAEYMEWVRGGIVFFLRPHRELVVADGVRAGLEWEEVVRIDGMVKLMLEIFDVPYIPVESLSMQERVRLVERVLDLAGLVQKGPVITPQPKMVSASGAGSVVGSVVGSGNSNGNGHSTANGKPASAR